MTLFVYEGYCVVKGREAFTAYAGAEDLELLRSHAAVMRASGWPLWDEAQSLMVALSYGLERLEGDRDLEIEARVRQVLGDDPL